VLTALGVLRMLPVLQWFGNVLVFFSFDVIYSYCSVSPNF